MSIYGTYYMERKNGQTKCIHVIVFVHKQSKHCVTQNEHKDVIFDHCQSVTLLFLCWNLTPCGLHAGI